MSNENLSNTLRCELGEALNADYCLPRAGCHTETYKGLCVITFDQTLHDRSCNYWYAVQSYATAHTAFHSQAGLYRWLEERGLELRGELPIAPTWGVTAIVGEYRQAHHLSYDAFYALPAIIETKVMSNGDYTLGRITKDADGLRTVHYLNCNLKHRPVYDYRVASQEMR